MRHRLQLDLVIKFASRWHAGSGEGSLLADRLIRRDTQNRPMIPGSTLKGIIRESCERLSRNLGYFPPSDPHDIDLTGSCVFEPFDKVKSPVDHLFGNKCVSGGLFFRDARPADTLEQTCPTWNRIARYRALGTAKHHHLFSSEYAPAMQFKTRIDGWHQDLVLLDEEFPPFAYCLLMAGIFAVERIGGDKSTGAGRLDGPIVVERATYNGKPVDESIIFDLLNPKDYQEMRGES